MSIADYVVIGFVVLFAIIGFCGSSKRRIWNRVAIVGSAVVAFFCYGFLVKTLCTTAVYTKLYELFKQNDNYATTALTVLSALAIFLFCLIVLKILFAILGKIFGKDKNIIDRLVNLCFAAAEGFLIIEAILVVGLLVTNFVPQIGDFLDSNVSSGGFSPYTFCYDWANKLASALMGTIKTVTGK
jgi:uncharacterized membrane protein required for colicin V production